MALGERRTRANPGMYLMVGCVFPAGSGSRLGREDFDWPIPLGV